jgi:hypothetical protein
MAKRRSPIEKKSKPQTTQPADAESGSEFPLGTETAAGGNHNRASMETPAEPSKRPMSEVEFNARVARKAFELFERRGGDSGHDVEDWLEAERLVREEILKEGLP